jgi:hypothetical protein
MAELVQLHTAQVLHSQEPAPTALRVEGVPNAKVLRSRQPRAHDEADAG